MKELLKEVNTLAIVCSQWGDTGKGKFVDYFADWANTIVRGTGGANAGHGVEVNGKRIVLHLVPSGIVRPGKINIIGNGVVLDPRELLKELIALREYGIDYEGRLFVAFNAKLVLPQHVAIDRMRNAAAREGKIGTTGRGIGPAYAHYYDRLALFINDLQNPAAFVEKVDENLKESKALIKGYNEPETFEKIMYHPDLGNGQFYSPDHLFDRHAIISSYLDAGKELRGMIADTDRLIRESVGRKKILLEGAQGFLLSVDHGTYPFVTSSDCSTEGLAKGVGLLAKQVDQTFSMVKAFYMTRVGEGPFPTEMGGIHSDEWCGGEAAREARAGGFSSVREMEAAQFGSIGLYKQDEFKLGIATRIAGDEYGATTGRPRRVGWLDLPLLRYWRNVSGDSEIILTKLDVLNQCPTIKVCTGYTYEGDNYTVGAHTLKRGCHIAIAIPDAFVLRHCKPIYKEFPGWLCDIRDVKLEKDLPDKLLHIIRFVEHETEVRARILSVGPDRTQTIILK
jgi:adenylosuccinate synthase